MNMFNPTTNKIRPIKLLLDNHYEVRATNFHGTSITGRCYTSPNVIFMRTNGKDKSTDIRFPYSQLLNIIDALTIFKIENENDEIFAKLRRYKTVFHFCKYIQKNQDTKW